MRNQFATFVFHLRNRLDGSLPRLATGCVAAAAIAGALWLGFRTSQAVVDDFSDGVQTIANHRADHPVRRAGELAQELFEKAVTQGWIDFDALHSTLELRVDCDALQQEFPDFDRRRIDPEAVTATTGGDQLTARQICRSDPGAVIRDEITAWNRNVTLAAVRDDRNLDAPCKDGTPPQGYVPENCYDSLWQGSFAPSSSDEAIADAPVAGIVPGPPPDQVRSVMRTDAIGFTPWRRFDVSGAPTGKLVLHSKVKANRARGERHVAVDVIGDLDPADPPALLGAGSPQQPKSVEWFCDRAQTSVGCQRAMQRHGGRRMARGVRLIFAFDAARSVDLRISVRPIVAVPRRVAALERAKFVAPDYKLEFDDEHIVRLTDRIQVRCRNVDPNVIAEPGDGDLTETPAEGVAAAPEFDLCGLYWVAAPTLAPGRTAPNGPALVASTMTPFAEPGSLTVRLSGPEPLVLTQEISVADPTGLRPKISRIAANEAARQLGLVPVVGIDDTDAESLLGQLRGGVPSNTSRDVTLTIDARLQRASFDLLKDLMGRAPALAEISELLPPQYAKDRRGAIVLMDAGATGAGGTGFDAEAGRILAAASWPQLDPRMSEEDIRTFATVRPWLSPLAARGWSGNDKYNAPGSSLKPIVALAAIDRAARGDNDIADFLGAEPGRPGLAPAALRSFGGPAAAPLQFSYTSEALQVPVGNTGRAFKITTDWKNICADMSAAKHCQPNATAPVNLRHMLAQSDNIWFARLALALDSDAVMTTDSRGRKVEITDPEAAASRPLAIARMVSRLWPPQARDIVLGDRVGQYSRVHATAIQLDETNPERARRQSVALNGIGQAAQATPLALASVFASIATGRLVFPRLTDVNDGRQNRGAPLFDAAAHDGASLDEMRAQNMLSNLRTALSDVVHVGTAAREFGPLSDRVWGKTGTAQVGFNADDPDTVWFVGWLEGLKVAGFEQRRIAFACMVTQANKHGAAGGRVCAPLMRILFQRLEAQHQLPAAAAAQQAQRQRP
jgi:cell division protein FtsI/penicillin-binding protein 2